MNPNLNLALTAFLLSLAFLGVFLLGLAALWWLLVGRLRPRPHPDRPANVVLSPSAGVVVSVAVHPGDRVAFGQELCVFENGGLRQAIRAARPGLVGSVTIQPGDAITRGQAIIEYQTQPEAKPDEPDPSVD